MSDGLEGSVPGGFAHRRLRAADAEALAALRVEMLLDTPAAFLGAPGDDPGTVVEVVRERLEDPRGRTVGMFDGGGALVSTAALIRQPHAKVRHKALIVSVYTTPRARRRGLQRTLLQALLAHARSAGDLDVIGLAVSCRCPGAQALYESLGFVAWGREPRAVRVGDEDLDEIHMSLDLSAPAPVTRSGS